MSTAAKNVHRHAPKIEVASIPLQKPVEDACKRCGSCVWTWRIVDPTGHDVCSKCVTPELIEYHRDLQGGTR